MAFKHAAGGGDPTTVGETLTTRTLGPGQYVDVAVTVPSSDYGPIEDMHMMFDHLCTAHLKRWIESGCPDNP